LTEHDDVITPLLRGAPRLGLALGPAPARADPVPINDLRLGKVGLRFVRGKFEFTWASKLLGVV